MKRILAFFASLFLGTVPIINTYSYSFSNSYFIKNNKNLQSQSFNFNFLFPLNSQKQTNNNLLLKNNLENNYYNAVFLKSLAYDSNLKELTSNLNNLKQNDKNRKTSSIDLYLDLNDYSKMLNNKKQIQQCVLFLNTFFHNQDLNFNPNGFVMNRKSYFNSNSNKTKFKNQQIISLNLKKNNSLNKINFLNNLKTNSNNKLFTFSINWSGVYFFLNRNVITQAILNPLNQSAKIINSLLDVVSSIKQPSAASNLFLPSWWPFRSIFNIQRFSSKVDNYFFNLSATKASNNPVPINRIDAMENEAQSINQEITNTQRAIETTPQGASSNLSGRLNTISERIDNFNTNEPSFEQTPQVESVTSEIEGHAAGEETSAVNVGEEIEGATSGVESAIDTSIGEAAGVASSIPILRWVVILIVTCLLIAISVTISVLVKKTVSSYNPNLTPPGPWTLKQLRFNLKTRRFRQIDSSQVQFSGKIFKPWFGKMTQDINIIKPLHALKPNIHTQKQINFNLQKNFNFISGTNSNFNLIVNPTIWKQMVASSYMPSAQFSVKQILNMNKVYPNNVYLSNQTWVNLIKQVPNVQLENGYGGVFVFKNNLLSYTNLNKSGKTNLEYNSSNYLKSSLFGNNNNINFILSQKQLSDIKSILNYLKLHWNDSIAKDKNNNPIFKGIKNSIKLNPKNYQSPLSWYYHYYLKNLIWMANKNNDSKNLLFLQKIFTQYNKNFINFNNGLNYFQNGNILDFNSDNI